MSPLNRVRRLFSRQASAATTPPPPVVIANPHLHACPYGPGFPEGRVDAGLDQSRSHVGPLFAVGAGTVTQIDPVGGSSWGGGGALYYKLDHPIKVQRGSLLRIYSTCYIAEMGFISPRIKVGTRLKPGQKIGETRSGWSECGFYDGQDMSGQLPTQPGYDWQAFYHWTLTHPFVKPKPNTDPFPSGTQVPHK